MKVIKNLNKEHKDALKFILEEVSPNDSQVRITIRDLRQIDKICDIITSSEGDFVELEDADFAFLKNKFNSYSSWNPQARKLVLETAARLDET